LKGSCVKLITFLFLTAILVLASPDAGLSFPQDSPGTVSGVVKDHDGAVVEGARVLLIQTQQAVLRSTQTGTDGRFRFEDVLPGTYEIRISRADFSSQRVSIQIHAGESADTPITLGFKPLTDDVTVTAEAGQVQDRNRVAQQVNVISDDALRQCACAGC
jgi:hypothetical protein